MSTVTIDARDFVEAAAAFDAASVDRAAGRIVATALKQSGNAVRKHVRKNLARHRRTGRLAKGVRQTVRGYGVDTQVTVRSGGPVAHLVSGGVRPHDIEPGKIMPIHGPGRAGPIVAFSAAVHHPGFRGDPYFSKGVADAGADINAVMATAADGIVAALAERVGRR